MSVDIDSQFPFGSSEGLSNFFLIHRLSHQAYQETLQQRFGSSFPTFGLTSEPAESGWLRLMQERKGPVPPPLSDWLALHMALHTAEYSLIGGGLPTDLAVVDFSDDNQFYDWMYAHQELHDFTDRALGT